MNKVMYSVAILNERDRAGAGLNLRRNFFNFVESQNLDANIIDIRSYKCLQKLIKIPRNSSIHVPLSTGKKFLLDVILVLFLKVSRFSVWIEVKAGGISFSRFRKTIINRISRYCTVTYQGKNMLNPEVIYLPNYVNDLGFYEKKISSIIYYGRLDLTKGVIKYVQLIDSCKLDIYVAGDISGIEGEYAARGLQKRGRYLGNIDSLQAKEFKYTILLSSNCKEGVSNSIVELGLSGTGIICNDAGYVSQLPGINKFVDELIDNKRIKKRINYISQLELHEIYNKGLMKIYNKLYG